MIREPFDKVATVTASDAIVSYSSAASVAGAAATAMSIEIEVILTIVGMVLFFGAGEYEARDGGPNHRMLWAGLSLVASIVTLHWDFGVLGWLLGQAILFIGIAAVRVWLEGRSNKQD